MFTSDLLNCTWNITNVIIAIQKLLNARTSGVYLKQCSTDDSLTKQINGARAGHQRDEVTDCVQSVTLPSAGISFPQDKNKKLCRSHRKNEAFS